MRYRSLDGLRGIAAIVVLIEHALMIVPLISAPIWNGPNPPMPLSLLVDTPLHVVWAGPQAVYVFFVLSGLVLGLAARSPRFRWHSYYPSRLVRLYLPIVASVAIVAPLVFLGPAVSDHVSRWVQYRPQGYSLRAMLTDMTLLGGISGSITPLWSLQWEIIFSLLLPIYLVLIRRRHLAWQIPALIFLAMVGARTEVGVIRYLPIFGLGVAMAAAWDDLSARLDRRRGAQTTAVWSVVLLMAVAMVTIEWPLRAAHVSVPLWALLPVELVGVCAIVVGAAFAPGFRSFLGSRTGRFLGGISFSLYLVHEPILIYFARVIPDPVLSLAVSLPVVAVATLTFWLLIERPAHRLSQRVRQRVEEAASTSPVPNETTRDR